MKKIIYAFIGLLSIITLISCEYDNYDEPETTLQIVVKDGDDVLNTSHGELFRLYQYVEDGYIAANSEYIPVNVDQEGKCQALLFPGRYKLVVNPGGKVNTVHMWNDFPRNEEGTLDTLYFELKGNKELQFDVTPYYRIPNFTATVRNDSIVAEFDLEQAHEASGSERPNDLMTRSVSLLVSPTMFVNNEVAKLQAKGSKMKVGERNQIRISLKNYYTAQYYPNNYRDYAYVRIAVALRKDATEYIYSRIIKVENIPAETINKFKTE